MFLEYVYFFIKKIKTEKIEKNRKNCILYLYFKIIKTYIFVCLFIDSEVVAVLSNQ